MSKNHYVSGSHNITCDRCSKKTKMSQVKQEWTGFIVCHGCYEERHPQDFVRARQDKISVPITRPIPPLVFVNVNYYFNGSAIANIAIAGKAISGNDTIP